MITAMWAQVSIKVGDGGAGVPMEDLVADLAHRVHLEAAAHYGRGAGCQYIPFHCEANTREEFAAALEEFDHERPSRHLAQWDSCIRPVAVIHWWAPAVENRS